MHEERFANISILFTLQLINVKLVVIHYSPRTLIKSQISSYENQSKYIDLTPLRAGLVDRPEEYRCYSMGNHVRTGNKDNFLSLDFGPVKYASLSLHELHGASLQEFRILAAEERLRGYRRYVYEAGAVDRSEIGKRKIIKEAVVGKERKKEFKISRLDRFRYRTRYFTDSGIIGTKEFVSGNYRRFKDLFMSKRDKIPKPVAGLDGMFSLKRLAEG